MHTSIPIEEALEKLINQIETTIVAFTREDVKDLTTVLKNMYFPFESQIYQQIEGLPMGSSLSGTLTILLMDKLAKATFMKHPFIDPYKRYVDDIYLHTTNETQADRFH